MRYLVVDGELSGTGIRDKYETGYIDLDDLLLRIETKQKLNEWVIKYQNAHFEGFPDALVSELEQEGRSIAMLIKKELVDVKMEYFSDCRMTREMI